jgi:hypothetical protein
MSESGSDSKPFSAENPMMLKNASAEAPKISIQNPPKDITVEMPPPTHVKSVFTSNWFTYWCLIWEVSVKVS